MTRSGDSMVCPTCRKRVFVATTTERPLSSMLSCGHLFMKGVPDTPQASAAPTVGEDAMTETPKKKTKAAAKRKLVRFQFPALGEGRVFLCIGPNVWGRNSTQQAQKAIDIAKKEFASISRSFGRWGSDWQFILFDAHESVVVGDLGDLCYRPSDIPPGQPPYRELMRYNMPPVETGA